MNLKGKIIAIGGGEIGRIRMLPDGSIKQYPIETREIDAHIVRLAHKNNPKLLFLGTASNDSVDYFNVVNSYFTKEHGCQCSTLNILSNPSWQEIKNAVFNTDIIYVGGGNTNKLIKAWKECGLDKLLKEALQKGVVLSGLSAGANCWFKHYCTDSIAIELHAKQGTHLSMADGLGFINGICVPHTMTETKRFSYATKMLQKEYPAQTLYAIDDYAALVWEDGKLSAITSLVGKKKNACVRKVTFHNAELTEEVL